MLVGSGRSTLSRSSPGIIYCRRRRPADLRARRPGPVTPASSEVDACRGIVLTGVAALRPPVDRIGQLTSEIAHAIRGHADGEISLSLFRELETVVPAARLLAALGAPRDPYPTAEHLAADASNSRIAVQLCRCSRRGCDKRPSDAIATPGNAPRYWHPWAQGRYAAAIGRGRDHPRAISKLGRV
jgi:hypothetical protein